MTRLNLNKLDGLSLILPELLYTARLSAKINDKEKGCSS